MYFDVLIGQEPNLHKYVYKWFTDGKHMRYQHLPNDEQSLK